MATIEQRMKEYEEAFAKSQEYNPAKFQTDFQKAYGEATGYNQDLINQQSQALGELQSVAPTLRSQYMGSLITDPAKQMALIAQARQAPITQWSSAANLLGARGQRYQDILANSLAGYQTSAQQANTATENTWRLYQDAVQQSQFNRSQGGAGTDGGLSSILKALFPEGQATQQITPQQRIESSINSLLKARQTRNIEANMPKYHAQIMARAKSLGLNLNPEALWVRLGNAPKTPQSLMLYL